MNVNDNDRIDNKILNYYQLCNDIMEKLSIYISDNIKSFDDNILSLILSKVKDILKILDDLPKDMFESYSYYLDYYHSNMIMSENEITSLFDKVVSTYQELVKLKSDINAINYIEMYCIYNNSVFVICNHLHNVIVENISVNL